MCDPMRCRDDGRPGATCRKAEAHAIAARAETDLLAAVLGHGKMLRDGQSPGNVRLGSCVDDARVARRI